MNLNTMRLKYKRKPYQLTLNQPKFNKFEKIVESKPIVDKKKMARLFPLDFIHSMDAMVPHIGVLKIDTLNQLVAK